MVGVRSHSDHEHAINRDQLSVHLDSKGPLSTKRTDVLHVLFVYRFLQSL